MIPYERQRKILNLLKDKELIKFDEIQEIFSKVSASTIRRDLKELENSNKIEYLSGGGIKLISTIGEIPITKRLTLNNDKKEKIANIAAKLIKDGDVIYLDSGTTCTLLFKHIFNKNITIYTTNTDIFSMKIEVKAEIIVIGGKYNFINSSLSGALTEDNLKNLYFTKAFLGVNGASEKFGVTTPTIVEAMKKRIVKEHSDNVYLLCDSTKFHKLSNVKSFELKDINIISDKYDESIGKCVSIINE